MTVIEAYRTRHAINAKAVWGSVGLVHVCMVDGLRVNKIRGGWRHDPSAVKAAAESTQTYDPDPRRVILAEEIELGMC